MWTCMICKIREFFWSFQNPEVQRLQEECSRLRDELWDRTQSMSGAESRGRARVFDLEQQLAKFQRRRGKGGQFMAAAKKVKAKKKGKR